jgi:hypothetical protein
VQQVISRRCKNVVRDRLYVCLEVRLLLVCSSIRKGSISLESDDGSYICVAPFAVP